ncbi:MAG TPA: class I SAM-dependent methyltransferase [Allosphingosinicella sp.]|nr:class I SAM-dependent methyltransferase [Allosphingosinicella sp.]
MKRRSCLSVLLGAGLIALLFLLAYRWFGPSAQPAERALPSQFDPARYTGGRPRLDAPNVASDLEVIDAMLALSQIGANDFVIDLGTGDGRILIAAARSLGARGLGVDIDPERIREANANARAAGVVNRLAFRREDLFRTPLAEADVLTLYLTQEVNLRLRPRILAQMRAGTRVVSHSFDMGDWRPDQRRRIGNVTVFLWIVPARIEGRWTLNEEGRSIPIALDQQYQAFVGTAEVNGGTVRIEQGALTGARIRFVADLGGGRRAYEGRVEGDAIVPADPRAGWRMVRAS